MNDRVIIINETITKIPDVAIVRNFEQAESNIDGCISVLIEGMDVPLVFDVSIKPQYPFRILETETISFTNNDLVNYSHVMRNGSICIHTAHSPTLSKKIEYDIESLKAWIYKYYLNLDRDLHYEHLIVQNKAYKGLQYAFLFNDVGYSFKKDQFGFVNYSVLNHGLYYKESIVSNIVQNFLDERGNLIADTKWNYQLKSLPCIWGLFVFVDKAPSHNQRWAFENWSELEPLLSNEFLEFLHKVENSSKKMQDKVMPLFIGYDISDTEIHWQVILLELGNFPIYGDKKEQRWTTSIDTSRSIDWALTRNCSYKYFFGRGKLDESLTTGKILIIGIGAVGSMLAKTLVRSGCTQIDLIDYDIKEPENICRSEYLFSNGITNKTNELVNELCSISPFFDFAFGLYEFPQAFDEVIKYQFKYSLIKQEAETKLSKYDFVFDCSADNDLLYILSELDIQSTLINLSISNHAKQLVCAVEHNRYDFICTQFNGKTLQFDIDDLHNPTGCWKPTFKASYNDINTLVQVAVKQINLRLLQNRSLRNFIIETDDSDSFTIKLKEF